jgi:hypothetical protein
MGINLHRPRHQTWQYTTSTIRPAKPTLLMASQPPSLLSCGQMCDAGYRVLFEEGKAKIFEGDVTVHGKVLMEGKRERSTGLWTVPLDNKNQEWGNEYKSKRDEITSNVYEINKVHKSIQYLHAASGSPVPSTFIKATEACHFVTWPTLTELHVRKYLKKSEATIKGHLNQTSKNARSTRPKKKVTAPDEEVEYEPHITKRTNVAYAAKHELEGHTYTEFTGRFQTMSSRGYKYRLVLYDYDGKNIQAEPMKSRSDAETTRAYTKIYDELTANRLKPTFQKMDNEASTTLKHFLHSKDTKFQLVAPYVHRQNTAEREIQTFKHHFIAMLCSTDNQFPIHLYDRLIPQAAITLNLLRQLRLNPKCSAHAQLNGPLNYNTTPLAPPGTRVIINEKPDQGVSWSPHGLNGWYIGPEMEHYRAHRVYCSITRNGRISDTVEFLLQHCKVPGISSADAATIAAADFTHALQNPTPTTPFKQLGTERMQALQKLAAIFEEMVTQQARTPRVDTADQSSSPPLRVETLPTRKVTTTRVPTTLTRHPATTNDAPYRARRSPQDHNPPQVTKEERSYPLLAKALPKVELAHAVTNTVTSQHLEYRHLLMRLDL